MDNSILRKYDIRGVYGKTLMLEDAFRLASAFAMKIKSHRNSVDSDEAARYSESKPSVVIGYDCRLSSPELRNVIVSAFVGHGVRVIDIGMVPTPLLYFAARYLEDGSKGHGHGHGVMITGSHNPPQYNGLKLVFANKPFFDQQITELGKDAMLINKKYDRDMIDLSRISDSDYMRVDVENIYIQHLFNLLNFNIGETGDEDSLAKSKSKSKLKIVWDPGNGATCRILADLVAELPTENIIINGQADGRFPNHLPDPSVAANLEQLRLAVLANCADFGIAFDGDGDRVVIMATDGSIVPTDDLLKTFIIDQVVGAGNLQAWGEFSTTNGDREKSINMDVVLDIKTSQSVIDLAQDLGVRTHVSKTGHSYIKNKMAEVGAIFGGEMSGHIFFADNYSHDDGLFAACKFIEIISKNFDSRNIATEFARYWKSLPRYYASNEICIDCQEEEKFVLIERLKVTLRASNINFNDLDGVKVSNEDGWWLIRASNTQSHLALRLEAKNEGRSVGLYQDISSVLKGIGIALNFDFGVN